MVELLSLDDKGKYFTLTMVEKTFPDSQPLERTVCVNRKGVYIGTVQDAERLCDERGISPWNPVRKKALFVASAIPTKTGNGTVGHTGLYFGFGIGSTVKQGDCAYVPYDLESDQFGRGEWTARTLEDAKQMAKDFAEGVS